MGTFVELDDHCFCCGKDNQHGLRLRVEYPERGVAETSFVIPERFSGWREVTHGGLLSMLLDELMAHACISADVQAVTAEMTVRFLKPVATGTAVRIVGKVVEERSRLLNTQGWIYDPAGVTIAEGKARFVRV
ncbi:MAG: PaaI family thioesterase [Acidobacteriota bacterium]